jgi:hypothetical protein
MSTSIEDLLAKFDEHHETQEKHENDLSDSKKEPQDEIFDFSLPQEIRIDSLNTYYQTNPEDIIEIISKLNAIYCMSPIGLMRKFIYEIGMYSSLPLQIRIDCAITLADISVSQELGLKCLDTLVDIIEGPDVETDIPTPCRLEYIMKLINSGYSTRISTLYVFICDTTIENEYRYRTILGMENNVSDNGFTVMINACKVFLENDKNKTSYRILACQNILARKNDIQDDSCEVATNKLIEFMTNENLPHNLRADAADVILHFGTEKTIQTAESVLRELGGRDIHNIYDNKENAHTETIETSVKETIQYIDALNLNPIPTLDTVSYNILQLAKQMYRPRTEIMEQKTSKFKKGAVERSETRCIQREQFSDEKTEHEERVETALLRIELDRTVFRDVNHTLQSILRHIYAYIQSHDCRKELEKRLVEELVDMAGTCSTGFIGRLVNTLSGFGEHSLRISWADQIAANLAGRLNAKMKEDENLDAIVEQMVNKDLGDRSAFLKFFRENISTIKEEMYQEFREHMEDTDWDLWFRAAIMNYEK